MALELERAVPQKTAPAHDDAGLFLADLPWRDAFPVLQELIRRLHAAGFEATEVLPRPGRMRHAPLDIAHAVRFVHGDSNLFHSSAMSGFYRSWMRRRSSQALRFHELFHLGWEISESSVAATLGAPLLEHLVELGAVRREQGMIRSRILITPCRGTLAISDALESKEHPEFLYTGRASILVPDAAYAAENSEYGRVLDVGCGSGAISLALSDLFDEVVGIDISERALEFARMNAALNGRENCRFHYSDLYSEVRGQFDMIVSNTPCGWAPDDEPQVTARHGGASFGTELPLRMIEGAPDFLTPNGKMLFTLTCPEIGGKPLVGELLDKTFAGRPFACAVSPLFEEFDYARTALYRRHGITNMIRYLVTAQRADRYSLDSQTFDRLRMFSYRLRTALPKLLSAIKN